jgi:hypothetical protein
MTAISTIGKLPEDKKEKLKKLREFHQQTLNKLGVSDAIFIPKMAYTPSGKSERHIAFFQSEINKGKDVFVEFCSKDNDPEFEDRALYQWKYNSHFEEEYEKTDPNPTTGHCRYLIPVAELVKVHDYSEQEEIEPTVFNIIDPDLDLPMSQMTMRDYAAIHMRKPISMKPWLNDIITK